MQDKTFAEKIKECGVNYGMGIYKTKELLGIVTRKNPDTFPEDIEETFQDPMAISGIGKRNVLVLNAVVELAKRLGESRARNVSVIRGPNDVFDYCRPKYLFEKVEHFAVLLLNIKNKIVGFKNVSVGSLDASIVHPREVFQAAIMGSAAAVIAVHNHPSGNVEPSREDIKITHRLYKAGELMDIPLLDHVIIGADAYCSLKDRNLLKGN